jgi:apolipoprotein N-acyltransferase
MGFSCTFNSAFKKILMKWTTIKANPKTSFLWGALAGASFPPVSFFAFMALGFSAFVYELHKEESARIAFFRGLVFGVGYFITSTYWVALSFQPVGLGSWVPLVIVSFAFVLAFFPAIACGLSVLFKKFGLASRPLFIGGFTFFWSLCEWLRGHIFTGFPWNLNGYVWDLPILQSTAWVGIYGLSIATTWAACVWACGNKKIIAMTCISFLLIWGAGTFRLKNSPGQTEVYMRLVQPSIQQSTKWQQKHLEDNMRKHMVLSQLPSKLPLQAIIWPEAAIAYDLTGPQIQSTLQDIIPPHGVLLLGGIRREQNEKKEILLFNSLFALNNKGNILRFYDKAHLVPFGEYVPFKSFFPIQKLTEGITDYTEGEGLKTLHVEKIPPFAPLICYEAVFPGQVINFHERPRWILNLTNDAWYGNSSGPYQHLAIVRVRAIEEGLPMVRVANSGISAVISPHGEILEKLKLYDVGVLDFYLPNPIEKTFYGQYHDVIYGLMMLGLLCFLITLRRRNG